MITVLLWKWNQPNYRSRFTAEHVNIMVGMLKRNLDLPHRCLCITDDPVDVKCETYPLWEGPKIDLPQEKPNCYRRLKVFDKDFGAQLGDRLFSIDLDTVLVDNITPIVDRKEDFVIWGDTAKRTLYNGGLWLMTPGARSLVWETFTTNAPQITQSKGIVGSDQAWISYVLGPGEAKWTTDDGVYSFRNHMKQGLLQKPKDARLISFHGQTDPWSNDRNIRLHGHSDWIRKHYRP